MSRSLNARLFRWGLTLWLFGEVVGTMPAQTEKVPSAAAPPLVESILLPQDGSARQRLAAAHDYVKVRSWPEAVRLLQALLDAKSDAFYRKSETDRNGQTKQRWRSVRGDAEELLAHLPKEGREFYRAACEGRARQALTAARADHDLAALQEVARRYRHTDAGKEALEQLGSYYLDRGEMQLADACFQQLLDSPNADRLAPLTLFQAIIAARQGRGAKLAALPAWQQLVERIGNDGLRLGKETYAADKIPELLSHWPADATDNSPLYRSDAARSNRGRGEAFLLEPRWRIDTAEGQALRWIQQTRRASRESAWPAAMPLALDGKIIYRGADGLHALDAESGRPLWRRPTLLSLASLANNFGQKELMRKMLDVYGANSVVLVENAVTSSLSGDNRRIYAIDDLPLPTHPSFLQNENDVAPLLRPLLPFLDGNRLDAFDANTGKVLWQLGASARGTEKAGDALRKVYFLGPPLPLGKQLFGVLEKQHEMSLFCLDAERGALRWMQKLALVHDPSQINVSRRTQAVHLAYREGVLVCPTNSGVLVGVDPLSRALLWAYVYAEPPTNGGEGMPGTANVPVRSGWKGAAPLVDEGRIVYTPPDSEAIFCLQLHDGTPIWKTKRGHDDLSVGCIHKGGVLVIARSTCRMLSLNTGEVLWQRASGEPAGLGVAAGSRYYLPLRGGALLALDLDKPEESMRLEARAVRGEIGNLLFHRGVLWSQSATDIVALMPLTEQLSRLEKRLAQSPQNPALLFERGRLHQERGALSDAVADLRAALTHETVPATQAAIRERLFAVLTQLLQRDFAAGEKYLDDYRSGCRVPMPASADASQRAAVEKERRRRETQLLTLLAVGREKQGRIVEALQVYRQLSRRCDELTTVPEDLALRTRPDRWVQARVAALLAHAPPHQRQQIGQQIHREGQELLQSYDRAALRRYLTLFDDIEGEEASLVAEVRLHLARLWANASGSHALEAELLLHELLEESQENKRSLMASKALHDRARLLTRRGLLDRAFADYRELARADNAGADLFAEIRTDKRFLPYLETATDDETKSQRRPIRALRQPSNASFRVPCLPCRHSPDEFPQSSSALDPVPVLPDWYRQLQFTVDGLRLHLEVADRASGSELYRIPLPLPSVPAYFRHREIDFQAVDHFMVLCVGPTLIAVDLLERRVLWRRNVLEGAATMHRMTPSGGVLLDAAPAATRKRRGLLGPIGPSAVCIQTSGEVIALAPLSGEVVWRRDDVARGITSFGDDKYLFLVEQPGCSSIRAVRTRDGVSVPIPDATAAYANCQGIVGRLLLVAEPPEDGQRKVRLYDPLSGKNLWTKTIAADAPLPPVP